MKSFLGSIALIFCCLGPAGAESTLPWLIEQAEKGDPRWQEALALKYLLGDEVPRDTEKALMWMRRSADQGYLIAIDNLADFYWKGSNNVPEDKTEAAKWLRLSAARGMPQSQYRLSLLYFFGDGGIAQDYGKAAQWMRKAAEQGHAVSQNNIGLMYSQGKGVRENQREAVKWYRRAAEQGYAGAQHNLALKLEAGIGVKQDLVEAYKWHALAAANDDSSDKAESERNRDALAAKLSADELIEAKVRASHFKPAKEED